ncbi:ABC transporter substrate-binding protein [Tenacibaculum agarivorans]|uniref:ABC transporter substrate-binding protein n=1 Tax=Tenacibaculum agarivorans TaxID=1908389 RepID=UPI00094BC313|nr:ABC transporter substrate-binding protein [Tenacibaculum agarivorans]
MKKNHLALLLLILITVISIYFFTYKKTEKTLKYAYTTALVDAPSMIAKNILQQNQIEPVQFSTGRETTQALLGNATNVATLAEWPFLLASDKRDDLQIVAVITSAKSMGIIANKDKGIDSIIQLKDKRVGFPQGTTAQYVFELLAKKNNISGEVKTINLTPPNLQPSLIRGDIDAMVVWQPFLEKARLENTEKFIYLPTSQDAFRVVYCVVSTKENIKNNPEGIKQIITSLIEAEEKINNGDKETLAQLSKEVGLDTNTLSELLPLFRFQVTLDDEVVNTLETLAVWAHDSGLTTSSDILTRDWKDYIHTKTLEEISPERVRLSQ